MDPGLTIDGQPDHGPPDPIEQCCARCGEPERHFVALNDGREVCESCLAIIRLEEFHARVTSER